jgi:DNA-binding protein H-NS
MAMNLRSLNTKQLDDLIERAQRRKEELQRGQIAEVRAKIQGILKSTGLGLEDVFRGPGRPGRRGPHSTKGKKVAPKYRNPADKSQTWSGRGRQPVWFREALRKGKKEVNLLIR